MDITPQLDSNCDSEKPSTSTMSHDTSSVRSGDEGPRPPPEALRYPRKSLPFLPRTTQYERHPLLQTKSSTGLSEFEMLILEKDLLQRRKSESRGCSDNRSSLKLVPRGAHYEPHPLLVKSESGVCELELYLQEMATEVAARKAPRSGEGAAQLASCVDNCKHPCHSASRNAETTNPESKPEVNQLTSADQDVKSVQQKRVRFQRQKSEILEDRPCNANSAASTSSVKAVLDTETVITDNKRKEFRRKPVVEGRKSCCIS